MKVAVLIDGAFFVKRIRALKLCNDPYDTKRFADLVFRFAICHLKKDKRIQQNNNELYRIFFYDCSPFTKRMHNPISGKSVDFAKSKEALFRNELHNQLKRKRKLALRLGKLSDIANWTIKPQKISLLLKNQNVQINEDDVIIDTKQKGVDMRIGIDITSIALKKQAKKIVLIAGDSDFVPAAKLARREGIDFILDPMWNPISPDLFEHIDGLKTYCPKPHK